jgi:hypothetical protein
MGVAFFNEIREKIGGSCQQRRGARYTELLENYLLEVLVLL